MDKANTALREVFERTDEHGEPVYPTADVLHLVPFFLLAEGVVDPAELSEQVAELLGAFLEHLGLGQQSTAEEVGTAIAAHYAAHPVNDALLAELVEVARNSVDGETSDRQRDVRKMLGEAAAALPVRADGPGNAGPLARFTLKAPTELDDDGSAD